MLVTFRIIDTQSRLHTTPAIISARELASLVTLLRTTGLIIDADPGETDHLPYKFEFNANSLALARFADTLNWREDIIGIIEEAQFLGRSLRVERADDDIDIQLRVSEHIALAADLLLRADTAAKLFAAIGIDPAKRSSISIDRLRDLLQQPCTMKTFEDLQIRTVFDMLGMTVSTDCGEQLPRLSWADAMA